MPDTAPKPWYLALSRNQWNTLLAANLGWLFDGFETFALILTVEPAMRGLLDPSQFGQIPAYIGVVIAVTLLGWGVGGMVGGVLADYIGRKRTMILAIMAYSIMTGLSALAFDWVSFVILRFLVGIAIGSEWSTGTSMMAEVWPDEARGRGASLMQCGIGIGFFIASLVWLIMGTLGPDAWRYMYLLGILPALLTGFALAFARATGEYGSVIFIAGNMPMVSEITPLFIITKLEQYDYAGATAIAVVMLLVSFTLLLSINLLQAWTRKRGQAEKV